MSQLGRIGGQVLTDNLLRSGVNLAFETDLLFLDVVNQRIGVRDSTPSYALDINNAITTSVLTATAQLAPANLRINAPNTVTTSVGGIDVYINGGATLFHDRLITDNLAIDENKISSLANANIVLDPNGAGTVQLQSSTVITGDLSISGNITLNGDLTNQGTVILGNQTIDTVIIATDFSQSIIPGDDNTYALGADAGDSSARRWADVQVSQWQYISNGAWPGSGIVSPLVTISAQLQLNGTLAKIQAVQSNEDVFLNPDTGITDIENTQWQTNTINNLSNTPLILASTGQGYVKISGSSAFVVPAGDISQRRVSPEVGETRWNTDLGYLECYDGTVWVVSTGGGIDVSVEIMEDLGHVYTLMLG